MAGPFQQDTFQNDAFQMEEGIAALVRFEFVLSARAALYPGGRLSAALPLRGAWELDQSRLSAVLPGRAAFEASA